MLVEILSFRGINSDEDVGKIGVVLVPPSENSDEDCKVGLKGGDGDTQWYDRTDLKILPQHGIK